MSFDALGLAPELVRVVADEGYTEPTPVQREAIPVVLAGRDLLATAQTGTGKTAAFVLPLLQRLWAADPRERGGAEAPGAHARGNAPAHAAARPGTRPAVLLEARRPRALVLTPTRELALQVEESVRTYGRTRPVRSAVVYGGVGFEPQARALRAGPAIVVATPGRLLDHVEQRTIDLSAVEVLVLDEADRMLDMGFIRDIRRVIGLLPARRQNLLFSATFSDEIRALAGGLLERPANVDVAPRNTAAELVEQRVVPVDRERKRELLSHLVRSGRISQALVFTRTKHGASRLAEQLGRDGIRAAAIHGNKSQSQRVRALDDFKAEQVDVLVATDIAARGIDIEALPFVVNYELPMVPADYVHRIGRTGRAGVGGRAVSLVCVDEAAMLRDIERLLRRNLPVETVEGFEPDRTLRPEPIRLRSAEHASRGGRTGGRAARPTGEAWPQRGPRPPGAGARRPNLGGGGRPHLDPRHHAGGDLRQPSAGAPRSHVAPPPRVPVALPGERLSRAAAVPAGDGAGQATQAHPPHRPSAASRPSVGNRPQPGPHPTAGRNRR
jgi:ATP-dependent RNA helicase RhlE